MVCSRWALHRSAARLEFSSWCKKLDGDLEAQEGIPFNQWLRGRRSFPHFAAPAFCQWLRAASEEKVLEPEAECPILKHCGLSSTAWLVQEVVEKFSWQGFLRKRFLEVLRAEVSDVVLERVVSCLKRLNPQHGLEIIRLVGNAMVTLQSRRRTLSC